MLNVAVVDDEAEERAQVRRCLDYVAEVKGISVWVDEFSSADSFLLCYESTYDIVFMDIEFPSGTDGMAAAKELRKVDKTVLLIFITQMAQMAVQGYEVDALDFIVKPLDKYAFLLKMTRALGRVVQRSGGSITVKTEGDLVSLRVNLIRYLQVQDHYVVYHSREGSYAEYTTLSAAEKKLQDPFFCRCDRGCLVNLRLVTVIKRDVCVVDGEELVIARTQRSRFKQAYSEFLSGMTGQKGRV